MFLNDFFSIRKLTKILDNEILAEIMINADHAIFEGHFPGNPIVPGVVSIQMISDILSKHLHIKLITTEAKSIKFTSMIRPQTDSELSVRIKYDCITEHSYKVIAEIFSKETVFTKFNGTFSKQVFFE
jgi:3-hydroxyacyl-[acyl-carrier-protein] dehydratase